jgi:2-amino-4-hydroxy-6-hydroxymethyldihydropteridine diphosphokinase
MPDARVRAAIALGSNLGDRTENLVVALWELSAFGGLTAISSFYDTEPVGYTDQPRFLNAVALLETDLEPLELLREMLAIEHRMGRDRALVPAKGPRVIDLDLILYGDCVAATTELTVPHPAMQDRVFVLEPLAEIAPEWVHPVLGRSVAELLAVVKKTQVKS